MKKKALILGNMDSNLGVQRDIDEFKSFLKGLSGGAWYENEIDVIKSPSKRELLHKIELYRQSKYDYFLFLFGGHGDTYGGVTYIEPSHIEKYDISEEYFDGIADKQLSIFDCCRKVRKTLSESTAALSMERFALDGARYYLTAEEIRKIYHDKLGVAVRQSLKLYACSIDEYAQDDDGGLYTQSLIKSAIKASDESVRTTSAIRVHNLAKPIVEKESRNEQHPTYKGLLRVLENQQLILSINPRKVLYSSSTNW